MKQWKIWLKTDRQVLSKVMRTNGKDEWNHLETRDWISNKREGLKGEVFVLRKISCNLKGVEGILQNQQLKFIWNSLKFN